MGKKDNVSQERQTFPASQKPWRVETKTNREIKNLESLTFYLSHAGVEIWLLSGKYISVFFRSSHLDMDNYSSMIFQVMLLAVLTPA